MTATFSPSNVPRIPRDRSRVVCQRCHARKVKCDLISRLYSSGSCTNCEKRSETCQRRDNARAYKQPSCPSPYPISSTLALNGGPAAATPPVPSLLVDSMETPSDIEHNERQSRPAQPPPRMGSVDHGYLGEHSVMSNQGPLTFETSASLGSFSRSIEGQTFVTTRADQLPSQSMIDASITAYFKYLYHRIPVVDHQDVASSCPSTLLVQSLCFVGSFLRHPKSIKGLQQTEEFYTKAKILFFLNHEHEPLTVLKASCLFSLWNVKSPSVVTIDCSWNWLGLAIRLALQMGLHRESTYSQSSNPSCARRIAWFLYAQDKIQSACFDRPQMLRTQEFDLRALSMADFEESQHDQARLFILYTELAKIYAKMVSIQHGELTIASEEVLSVLSDMRNWALNIPPDLQISDDQGKKAYNREFYEFLVCYLTCIITYFHICGRYFQPSVVSRISLVASSCIISLYQEMDYRDDLNYLTAINNWCMMAASLPQLNNLSRENHSVNVGENTSGQGASSLEELNVVLDILRQRTFKFPGAKAIVHRIERLKQEVLSQHHGSSSPSSGLGGIAVKHSLDPTTTTYATVSRVHELFPFPKALSPRLELLDTIEAEDIVDGLFDSYPDWPMEDLLGLEDIDLFG